MIATITRAWQPRNEAHRIHFILVNQAGTERHLFADEDSKGGLYSALEKMLPAKTTRRS